MPKKGAESSRRTLKGENSGGVRGTPMRMHLDKSTPLPDFGATSTATAFSSILSIIATRSRRCVLSPHCCTASNNPAVRACESVLIIAHTIPLMAPVWDTRSKTVNSIAVAVKGVIETQGMTPITRLNWFSHRYYQPL